MSRTPGTEPAAGFLDQMTATRSVLSLIERGSGTNRTCAGSMSRLRISNPMPYLSATLPLLLRPSCSPRIRTWNLLIQSQVQLPYCASEH